jgi:hypothetical protein
MSTFVDFTPSSTEPFQFQPALLDGTQYTVIVTSNMFREGYYINVYDLSNNLIVCKAMAESGPTFRVSLTWDSGIVTAAAQVPFNVPIGEVANLRISQSNDSPFDGEYEGLAIDTDTMTFPLATNPQQSIPIAATLSFDVDLLAGYNIGSLYFHDDTQQFEF